MKNLYLRDIIEKCNGKVIIGDESTLLENFSKDTRTILAGEVYVGIKGETFEGGILYEDALNKGAVGCILNNSVSINPEILKKYSGRFIVLVEDTVKCLQDLASYKRSLYDIPVIAVTGSVGKTSTKDILASVLSKKYNVLKTEGNYNNHIGLPLTILKLKDHNALVLEMGMSHIGEISVLSKIAKPTVSVITNVGTAHIGNLGSRENILKAKLEILDGMDDFGTLIINNDNDMLYKWYLENQNKKIITFGIDNTSDFMATNVLKEELSSTYNVKLNDVDYKFKINVPGDHFVLNGLCALCVGSVFGIDKEDIKDGIENFVLTKRRMEIEKVKNITIINDCYNANLDSISSAINYLGGLSNVRKILVVGDMLELGKFEEDLHRKVGKVIFDNNIDVVITVGKASKYIYDELLNLDFKNVIYSYDNNVDAIDKIKAIIRDNDVILIKASYGMNFIEIYNQIKQVLV